MRRFAQSNPKCIDPSSIPLQLPTYSRKLSPVTPPECHWPLSEVLRKAGTGSTALTRVQTLAPGEFTQQILSRVSAPSRGSTRLLLRNVWIKHFSRPHLSPCRTMLYVTTFQFRGLACANPHRQLELTHSMGHWSSPQ